MKGIQVCSNEGLALFQGEIAKLRKYIDKFIKSYLETLHDIYDIYDHHTLYKLEFSGMRGRMSLKFSEVVGTGLAWREFHFDVMSEIWSYYHHILTLVYRPIEIDLH